ncbi:MAG: 50S ribosomal protein L11 methyltransferase [Crocinitomicaceae bacterium]
MNYIELRVEFSEVHPWRDIMIAQLGELGFESFVETKTGLNSYIPETIFDAGIIDDLKEQQGIANLDYSLIEDQNWNAKWEENFEPVFVDDLLVIRAPFHSPDLKAKMVVTIQPQMSFGTGHHQTTWLMAKKLFELDLTGKEVLDMGTGTGVLAIVAEKLGAKKVFAPDIDEWSFRNALENVALNNCEKIEVALGDDQTIKGRSFDLIIANINKNVLIQHFSVYSECIKPGGMMLISGFFETDQGDLKKEAGNHGFIFEETFTKDEWAMMQFKAPNRI